ncbi:glycosyltransferase family 4 protein [Cellulomonas xiejunii]|uniref:Glycosyltransferase family 4 protein n=1 Tax=Cellulomonas xiejunii TaxID=2968083 RepID=A0ABY5KN07_9CELL|nr:glycosyltransferase family 1 protein [Cellulomonas xiejunii]MCC2312931.1 glycosyltransferase family 4 protein [Cellulomonas xiejunii]MCC2320199.1 glycosyltransferase family 4 protein [Cellulomonas xiejunii]UUI70506.1 glycosyltransferase family 4 protein [Cellulomonas xiejunii]
MDPLQVSLTVEQCWQPVPGGSGSYVAELTRALVARDDVQVTGLAARHRRDAVPDPAPAGRTVTSALPRVVLYEAWSRWRRPLAESAAPADVVHATTWAVPGTRCPLVVTVHDLAFLRDPRHFTARGNAWFRRALEIVRDEAALVVVPSDATRDDCITHGIEADRIRVVRHGVHPADVSPQDVAGWRRRTGVERPYVLWCGTLEPRKNVRGVVAAFAAAQAQGLEHDLVLVGPRGWGAEQEHVARAVDAVRPGSVRLLGRLSAADLQTAYAGASAFVFPSLWEGFGLPVLEAMAHGVPVVTSAGSSMAELTGDLAELVEPTDLEDLAAGLARAVASDAGPALRRLAAEHTWEASAAAHVGVYREAAAARAAG